MNVTIIGCGNMGSALAIGWAKQGINICVTAKSQATLDRISSKSSAIKTSLDNKQAIAGADIIVLAVKPWLIENVSKEIASLITSNQIVCSVAAGILTDKLALYLGTDNCFYCMPNIGAEFCKSMTFISDKPNGHIVEDLFKLVGDVIMCDEKMIAPGMMMGGCGIAYVMRFLRAQMQAGTEMGWKPKDALNIAMQTMEGAIALLRETGLHPEAAIDRVTTPGGTTIKGLNELDHSGFTSAIINCLKAGLK